MVDGIWPNKSHLAEIIASEGETSHLFDKIEYSYYHNNMWMKYNRNLIEYQYIKARNVHEIFDPGIE